MVSWQACEQLKYSVISTETENLRCLNAGSLCVQIVSNHTYMKKHLPLLGALFSLFLFLVSANLYPGGTMTSTKTVGYDWANNTISALFQPNALNGDTNPARYFAIAAMLVYCFSLTFIFRKVSKNSTSKVHQKTIQIAGIGFSVYAFLIVTPMHNLMVSIALVFFIVTVVSMLHNLYLQKNKQLLVLGLVCISIPLINATLYYGDFIYEILPAVQKIGAIACAVWFILVYYYDQGTITNQNVHITSVATGTQT